MTKVKKPKEKSKKKLSTQASVSQKSAKQNSYAGKLIAVIKTIHPAVIVFGILILVYFCLTFSSLHQRYIYLEMKEPGDSSAFMQASWTILNGSRPPYSVTIQEHSMPPDRPYNMLGMVLYLTLSLFSPISLFFSSGVPFLVIQALIISLAAIPLYLLAAKALDDKWLALLVAATYLFNTATYESFEKFGFRVETLFIPAFFALFYFMEKEKYVGAGISLLFAVLTKHNMIMISFMLGLYYLIFDRRHWRFGIFCLMVAVGHYLIGVRMVLYKFQTSQVASFRHFAAFGATPKEALINMILNPGKIFDAISPLEWDYIHRIFYPGGFLAFLHPVFWVCLPQLVMNAVMTKYHSIYCAWHWAAVVPFIFVGIVYTIRWIINKFPQIPYLKYVFFAILISSLYYNLGDYDKTVLAADKTFYLNNENVDTSKIIDRLSIIEPDASVMVSAQLLWFFANRNYVYVARKQFHTDVDYIVILLPMGHPNYLNMDRYLLEEAGKKDSIYFKQFKLVVKDPNLIILKNKKIAG